ncbi:hypothetical protein ACPA0F_18335 [Solibacillus silvestris]
MKNIERLLFAEKIIRKLNLIQPGWELTNRIKGTTDFITVQVNFTNNFVKEEFYLMVGQIHYSPEKSEFADLLYNDGSYTDAVTVINYDNFDETYLKNDVEYFFEAQRIAV